MSGIGLIWNRQGEPVDPQELHNMAGALRLAGPAAPNIEVLEGVGFLSNHFSTVRNAKPPIQPVSAGDGRWRMLFDGRLDHRADLTQALGVSGDDAAAMPDACLAARAWVAWGESGLERWFGDFACIIWDSETRELRLFCDPFGRRSLHYYADARRVVVSSMPRGIHAVSGIERVIDSEKLADVACGLYLHRQQTCFSGIRRVDAGEIVRFTPDSARSHFFYALEDHIKPIHYSTDDQYSEAMWELINNAVANTIRPSERAAVAMSGGLDSTTVAVVAANQLTDAQSRLPVYTLVPDPEWDGLHEAHVFANEGGYARAVVDHCPTLDLSFIDAAGRGIFDVMDRVHRSMEMPQTGILNMIWFDALFAKAKSDGASVLLNGEFGNSGFSYAGSDAASQLLRSWNFTGLARQLSAESGGSFFGALRRLPGLAKSELLAAIPDALRAKLIKSRGSGFMQTRSRALSAGFLSDMRVIERAVDALSKDVRYLSGRAGDRRMLSLKHLLFVATGVTSSGWSALHEVEFRDPLADRKLMEWCLGVPDYRVRRAGVNRGLAKHTMQGRLPHEVLHKPLETGRQLADWHVRLSRDLERIRAEFGRFSKDPQVAAMLDLDRLNGFLDAWPAETPTDHADPMLAIRGEIPAALSIGRFVLDTD